MHLLCWQSKAGIWSCGWCISCWLSGLPLFVGHLPEIVQQSSSNADQARPVWGCSADDKHLFSTVTCHETSTPRFPVCALHPLPLSWRRDSVNFLLSSWYVRCWRFHRSLRRQEVLHQSGLTHLFLHVNAAGIWGVRLLKLFVEWQLLSYCIICKNSFDRFNKWIVYDVLLKS